MNTSCTVNHIYNKINELSKRKTCLNGSTSVVCNVNDKWNRDDVNQLMDVLNNSKCQFTRILETYNVHSTRGNVHHVCSYTSSSVNKLSDKYYQELSNFKYDLDIKTCGDHVIRLNCITRKHYKQKNEHFENVQIIQNITFEMTKNSSIRLHIEKCSNRAIRKIDSVKALCYYKVMVVHDIKGLTRRKLVDVLNTCVSLTKCFVQLLDSVKSLDVKYIKMIEHD
jgi:hypothetical protein